MHSGQVSASWMGEKKGKNDRKPHWTHNNILNIMWEFGREEVLSKQSITQKGTI